VRPSSSRVAMSACGEDGEEEPSLAVTVSDRTRAHELLNSDAGHSPTKRAWSLRMPASQRSGLSALSTM
jgi:hypothetical protein